MNLITCKKICDQCPFRKTSLSGWLGSHTIDEIENTHRFEGLFSCHKTRGESEKQNEQDILNGKLPICRGFLAMSKASCKMFGSNPVTGKELSRLQKESNITEEEKESVLPIWEFRIHHSKYLNNAKTSN